MIPKTIYICHSDKDYVNENVVPKWKRLNPEYTVKVYDNNMCEQFFLDEYSENECEIFKYITSGVYKSDFWRCFVLYKYGGIYVDADIEPLVPLKMVIEDDDDFSTCVSHFDNGFNPHFIMCKKGHPDIKLCMDEFIVRYQDKMENGTPGHPWVSVCHIFEKVFKKLFDAGIQMSGKFVVQNETFKIMKELYHGKKVCIYGNIAILENKSVDYPEKFNEC